MTPTATTLDAMNRDLENLRATAQAETDRLNAIIAQNAKDWAALRKERDELAASRLKLIEDKLRLMLVLGNLKNACMASDFNEHWEEFKEAEALLKEMSSTKAPHSP